MSEEVVDDCNPEPGNRVMQFLILPDHPAFEEAMKMDVFDIVRSRQFHHEQHLPVCFKYGSKRKCRFRFSKVTDPEHKFRRMHVCDSSEKRLRVVEQLQRLVLSNNADKS
jgi:hypothetical protein